MEEKSAFDFGETATGVETLTPGRMPNTARVADMEINGWICAVSATPKKLDDELDFMDIWYPIQVKRKDKVCGPDIDTFESVTIHEDRLKGFFVSFDFTSDALGEIQSFFAKTGKSTIALTVKDSIKDQIAHRLA